MARPRCLVGVDHDRGQSLGDLLSEAGSLLDAGLTRVDLGSDYATLSYVGHALYVTTHGGHLTRRRPQC